MLLQRTFEGYPFSFKTDDGKAILDCMLFTGNCEKREDDNPEASYKDLHTFILSNPNAMSYQQMVN